MCPSLQIGAQKKPALDRVKSLYLGRTPEIFLYHYLSLRLFLSVEQIQRAHLPEQVKYQVQVNKQKPHPVMSFQPKIDHGQRNSHSAQEQNILRQFSTAFFILTDMFEKELFNWNFTSSFSNHDKRSNGSLSKAHWKKSNFKAMIGKQKE